MAKNKKSKSHQKIVKKESIPTTYEGKVQKIITDVCADGISQDARNQVSSLTAVQKLQWLRALTAVNKSYQRKVLLLTQEAIKTRPMSWYQVGLGLFLLVLSQFIDYGEQRQQYWWANIAVSLSLMDQCARRISARYCVSRSSLALKQAYRSNYKISVKLQYELHALNSYLLRYICNYRENKGDDNFVQAFSCLQGEDVDDFKRDYLHKLKLFYPGYIRRSIIKQVGEHVMFGFPAMFVIGVFMFVALYLNAEKINGIAVFDETHIIQGTQFTISLLLTTSLIGMSNNAEKYYDFFTVMPVTRLRSYVEMLQSLEEKNAGHGFICS